ncbi:MAG: hypothetical protein ACREB9_02735 [Thermoplasmata archaeon]
MRKITLITGVVLLLLGAAYGGYFLSGESSTWSHTIPSGDYAEAAFISSIGSWAAHVTWTLSNSSAVATFYFTNVEPTSCTNVAGVLGSQTGSGGSFVADVIGNTHWFVFACAGSGNGTAVHVSVYGYGLSYYLAAGLGLGALGGGVVAFSFFQAPSPPLLSRPPPIPPAARPPTAP